MCDCVALVGVSKTSLDDVASGAGCSRATLYRYFSNKQELLSALIAREAEALSGALADATAESGSLNEACAAIIVEGAEFLLDHAALSAVLAIEPAAVLRIVTLGGADEFIRAAAALVAPNLAAHMETQQDALRLADLLVRITLSHLQNPDPQFPITDPPTVARLVEQYITPGFVREPAAWRTDS